LTFISFCAVGIIGFSSPWIKSKEVLAFSEVRWGKIFQQRNNNFIVMGYCSDNSIRLWDETGQIRNVSTTEFRIVAATLSPDGNHIVILSESGDGYICDVVSGLKIKFKMEAAAWRGAALPSAVYINNAQFLVIGPDGKARAFEGAEGKLKATITLADRLGAVDELSITCIALSPDGELALISNGAFGYASLCNLLTMLETFRLRHNDSVFCAAFSNRSSVATVSEDIRLWDTRNGIETNTFGNRGEVREMQFSPCANRILLRLKTGNLEIASANSGSTLCNITCLTNVSFAAFTAPETIIACTVDGKIIYLTRRFPEYWWGHFYRFETWLLLVSLIGIVATRIRSHTPTRRKGVKIPSY